MIKLTGFKDIDRKLRNLNDLSKHKIVGSAIFKAAKPILEAQKQILVSKTQRKTGNLERSLGRVRVPIKKANMIGVVQVGPRIGGRKPKGSVINTGAKNMGYHGHLIEFGTNFRRTKSGFGSGAKGTGYGPKLPFIAPAYTKEIGNVRSNIYKNLNQVFNTWVRTEKVGENYVVEND